MEKTLRTSVFTLGDLEEQLKNSSNWKFEHEISKQPSLSDLIGKFKDGQITFPDKFEWLHTAYKKLLNQEVETIIFIYDNYKELIFNGGLDSEKSSFHLVDLES